MKFRIFKHITKFVAKNDNHIEHDFAGFNSKSLFDEFIGPYCEAYNIPVKIENNIMEVG